MTEFLENSEDDFTLFSNVNPEIINESEEQQKILKNVISEFRKYKANKEGKKLYNSSTIKKVPNFDFNKNRNKNSNNVNGKLNEDGTITETRIEKLQNGKEKIIKTRYDKNHKIISRKIYYNDNNINNNNNINYNNNIRLDNNRGHIFKASNGFTIETKIETLPNGKKIEVKIIRDENNNVVDIQEDEIIDNNYMNNNFNMPSQLNYMRQNMYSQIPNSPLMHNNNMNNFQNNHNNYGINNQINNIGMNMNNVNNIRGFGYNNNMGNMPMPMPIPMPMPMMNNYGYPVYPGMNMMMPIPLYFDPNRVDPNILNSLPETEVTDASKLDPDNKNCVICLEDFKDKEHMICLPCIHVFHSECIKSWLNSHNCCPTCKFELTYQNLNSNANPS